MPTASLLYGARWLCAGTSCLTSMLLFLIAASYFVRCHGSVAGSTAQG
jgi:hypothetical protein